MATAPVSFELAESAKVDLPVAAKNRKQITANATRWQQRVEEGDREKGGLFMMKREGFKIISQRDYAKRATMRLHNRAKN
jgi:hypothetical protein